MKGAGRADVRTAAAIVGLLIGVGVLAGVLWWWIAPQPSYRVETDGLYFIGSQPQEYVAADGWFLVITSLIGALAGVAVWGRVHRTPLGALVGLFLGGLAGAATAAAVGMVLGRSDPFDGAIGSITYGALEIRAWGVLLAEAGFAVAAWLLLDLLVLRVDDPTEPPTLVDAPPADGTPDYGAVRDL